MASHFDIRVLGSDSTGRAREMHVGNNDDADDYGIYIQIGEEFIHLTAVQAGQLRRALATALLHVELQGEIDVMGGIR